MLRKLLTRSGSGGVSSVTVGLSSVGPPPTLMMIQLFASADVRHLVVRLARDDRLAAKYVGVEAAGTLDIIETMKWAKTISSSMLLMLTSFVGIGSMVAPHTTHRVRP